MEMVNVIVIGNIVLKEGYKKKGRIIDTALFQYNLNHVYFIPVPILTFMPGLFMSLMIFTVSAT